MPGTRFIGYLICAVAVVWFAAAGGSTPRNVFAQQQAACVDHSNDPAGCQPSTFDTPMAQMPSVRVNRQGEVDPTSSEADAKAGAFALEKRLHLFRNFEHLHWVVTVPSEKNPATGAWRGGDLDGAGDGRGLGIAGNCIFVGHANGAGSGTRSTSSGFSRIPSGSRRCRSARSRRWSKAMRASMIASCARSSTRRPRARTATSSFATPAPTRSAGWRRIRSTRTRACRSARAKSYDFHAQSHEFFLWHDPANPNRILVYMTNWTGGVPDPENPGLKVPDLMAMAVTDEEPARCCRNRSCWRVSRCRRSAARRSTNGRTPTGLFSDGRFLDFSDSKNALGQAG